MSWYINGEEADPSTIRKFKRLVTGREGLETSTLGLTFRVRHKHFKKGDMKLKVIEYMSERSTGTSSFHRQLLQFPAVSRANFHALLANERGERRGRASNPNASPGVLRHRAQQFPRGSGSGYVPTCIRLHKCVTLLSSSSLVVSSFIFTPQQVGLNQ